MLYLNIENKFSTEVKMKEVLYTIPMNDALNADTECPLCYIEKDVEQDLLDYVLGSCSSYMEADTRALTDAEGFCRNHFKKMFEYGNTLGNGWILKTHYMTVNREFKDQIKHFKPIKQSLKDRIKGSGEPNNSMTKWVKEKENSCYICKRFDETFDRYIATFFHLYKNDADFRQKLSKSKGFCLSHFGILCNEAMDAIPEKDKDEFYSMMFRLMEENMDRLKEDVSWLVEKFDYKNKDADWKNSKDAVQRGMQKLKGGIYG